MVPPSDPTAAIESADSQSSNDDDERTVCFCHNVTAKTIKEAIEAGARTHADIQVATRASTGCGGCEFEVLEILKQRVEGDSQKK